MVCLVRVPTFLSLVRMLRRFGGCFLKDTMKEQQKEIRAKMAELCNRANQKKGKKKKGGFLGKVLPMAGKALYTAFGGPIGGAIGGMAGNAIGGAASGGSKGAMSKEEYQDSCQMMMEELKNMMQKLQQMQQALSNVLNSMPGRHELGEKHQSINRGHKS